MSQQIRRDGNSIAHGDIGDEAISADDAEAIIEFMDALLDGIVQRRAKLGRLKARHDERKQSNSAVTGFVGEARPNVSAGEAEML
ncbi:hypothetical protein ACWGBX_16520 [Streptomyces sp. NPDC055037]